MADITTARNYLVLTQPFFASILLRRQLKECKDIPTLCVNRAGEISYNPEFVEKLTHQELVFCLCHEVMHVVCMHAIRIGTRDPQLWNVAGDLYINDFLVSSGVGSMPKGALFKAGSAEKTTEQIYDELPKDQQSQQQSSSGDPMGGDLDNSGDDLTPDEVSEIEVQTKIEVAEAAAAARNCGKSSGALSRLVKDILDVKTPWHEILANFMQAQAHQEESWKRPNRRFIDAYLPSQAPFPSLGEVVVGIDTSGSIGPKELQQFASHLNAILENCQPEKVHVVYCDTEVSDVVEYTADDLPVRLEAKGGGGTDMCAITEWIEDNDIEASCCVILTDMYTPFPETSPCPLIWAATTDYGEPPCGDVVRIEGDGNA